MIAAADTQLREDHGLAQAGHESTAWEANRNHFGVSFKQGHRTGWWDAVRWVLAQQELWAHLPKSEQDHERSKGLGSVFYPLFKETT